MIDPRWLADHYIAVGIAIGLASAAPIGPVNLLVIQRALSGDSAGALAVGLAAACGDILFASISALGLGALAQLVGDFEAPLQLVGGALMLAFALVIWRAAPHIDATRVVTPLPRTLAAAFMMTITNPATLLFFVASFGAVGFVGMGHDSAPHITHALQVMLGVFCGAMAWWLAVCTLARYLERRIHDRHLVRLNHATAGLLALFGIAAIVLGWWHFAER